MELVREFHRIYKLPILPRPEFPEQSRLNLRNNLNREEATVELPEAVASQDMVAVADAIGDSIYVLYGMALELGVPIDIVLAGAIQPSNMSKLDESGWPIFRNDGKVLKGPNFFFPEPAIREILISAGWTPPT